MPPRRPIRKRTAASGTRRSRKGSRAPLLVALLVLFAALAAAGFYLLNQKNEQAESTAAKARKIARENPNAEVFSGDVNPAADVKKK